MRRITAVDVAGRDLGAHDVGGGHRLRSTVVAEALEAVQRAGEAGIQGDHLPAVFTVQPHEAIGLLDDAVRLAGNEVPIVGQPDVDALAAAVQRQHQPSRLVRGVRPDGHRALERGDRAAERLEQVDRHRPPIRRGVAGHQRRDHLGVGRDRPGDPQTVLHLEVGVVVDVAVEDADGVRRRVATALLQLLAVHRVGVGLGDDADAGPTGVPEHGDLGPLTLQRLAQEGVLLDLGPQRAGVVAELADLGRRLVHDRQRRTDEARRPGLEQRIAAAAGQCGGDVRIGCLELVVPHEDVHAGRVAAAHLHAVDRRQRLLDGQVAGEGGRAGVAPGQVGDGVGRAQSVAAQLPQHVEQLDRGCAAALQLVGVGVDIRRREGGVDLGGVGVELVEAAGDRTDELPVVGQGEHPRRAAQQQVDAPQPDRHRADVATHGQRGVEPAEHLIGSRDRAGGGTAQDADDAAHGPTG